MIHTRAERRGGVKRGTGVARQRHTTGNTGEKGRWGVTRVKELDFFTAWRSVLLAYCWSPLGFRLPRHWLISHTFQLSHVYSETQDFFQVSQCKKKQTYEQLLLFPIPQKCHLLILIFFTLLIWELILTVIGKLCQQLDISWGKMQVFKSEKAKTEK